MNPFSLNPFVVYGAGFIVLSLSVGLGIQSIRLYDRTGERDTLQHEITDPNTGWVARYQTAVNNVAVLTTSVDAQNAKIDMLGMTFSGVQDGLAKLSRDTISARLGVEQQLTRINMFQPMVGEGLCAAAFRAATGRAGQAGS